MIAASTREEEPNFDLVWGYARMFDADARFLLTARMMFLKRRPSDTETHRDTHKRE